MFEDDEDYTLWDEIGDLKHRLDRLDNDYQTLLQRIEALEKAQPLPMAEQPNYEPIIRDNST